MLSLEKQNYYRELYRTICPGWQTSGELYESIVRRYIRPETSLLDLGCGLGGVTELFSKQVDLPVGTDPDWHSLKFHRDSAVRRVASMAEQLPFRDGAFDLVVCSWVLEHLPDPGKVFAEIGRVLKDNGHFVFIAPNRKHPVTFINRLVPRVAQAGLVRMLYGRAEEDTFPVAYRANTSATIDALAAGAGLEKVRINLVEDPTYLAFNDFLFQMSCLMERWLPQAYAVHIVGHYTRRLTTG